MSRAPSRLDLERLLDGELDSEKAAAFRAHIAGCKACAAELRALEDLNRVLRTEKQEVTAPPELRDRVARILRGQVLDGMPAAPVERKNTHTRRNLARRNLGVAAFGALVAGLAGLVVVPRFLVSRLDTEDIAKTLIRDFETFLFAERVLDFAESDPAVAVAWFRERLKFDLPRLPADLDGLRLRGGRLCWLFDRRLASLSFETGEEALALYIMRSEGTALSEEMSGPDASIHRQDRFTNVIWRHGDLVLGLVGQAAPGRVEALAQLISQGGRE